MVTSDWLLAFGFWRLADRRRHFVRVRAKSRMVSNTYSATKYQNKFQRHTLTKFAAPRSNMFLFDYPPKQSITCLNLERISSSALKFCNSVSAKKAKMLLCLSAVSSNLLSTSNSEKPQVLPFGSIE